jgi:hypothetical protein
MKRCLVVMCSCALFVSAVVAQEKTAKLLPKPVDFDFTLEASMKSLKGLGLDNYRGDDVTGQGLTSNGTQKESFQDQPDSVVDKQPATMVVRTEALLELHSMRENAVDLCIHLPTKYRTRSPECADIFKHEIRLQALARNKK